MPEVCPAEPLPAHLQPFAAALAGLPEADRRHLTAYLLNLDRNAGR